MYAVLTTEIRVIGPETHLSAGLGAVPRVNSVSSSEWSGDSARPPRHPLRRRLRASTATVGVTALATRDST
nr:hypothetical protein OG999_00690 [Streptomyces sp. NBC_00886]